jgi:hypothetical protein
MSRDAYDPVIAEPSERDDDDEFGIEIDGPPEPAPSWDILERRDFDAETRRIARRLLVWSFIRSLTCSTAINLGVAVAGFTIYSVCPEPLDLLIETVRERVAAERPALMDLSEEGLERAAREGGHIN